MVDQGVTGTASATPRRKMDKQTPQAGEGGGLSVGFLLMPDFTLLAFTSFVDALRIAADEWDRSRQIACQWTILSPDDKPIRASCGVDILPQERLRSPADFDYIVVVGGLVGGHDRINRAYYDYLEEARRLKRCVVGLCTGSFVLARAGLMKGHRACVHWFHEQDFRQEFPDIETVTEKIFLVDRGVITCVGGTSALDLAVHLINAHCGMSRALKSLVFAVVDRMRDHGSPLPHSLAHYSEDCEDPLVRRAVAIVNQQIGKPISMASLACRLDVSVRQLERSFRRHTDASPTAYFRTLRLRHGDWLLRNTRRQVTDIALDCGFADASHFTRCYRSAFGIRPSDARLQRQSAGKPDTLTVIA
jgi:transcriptional regulator GlxA family with amidase domain